MKTWGRRGVLGTGGTQFPERVLSRPQGGGVGSGDEGRAPGVRRESCGRGAGAASGGPHGW